MVYPMLVLTYLGQGAGLIQDGAYIIANPFYASITGPQGGGVYWWVAVNLAGTSDGLLILSRLLR